MLLKNRIPFIGALLWVGSALASCGGMIDSGMPPADAVPPVPPTEHPPDPEPCATGAFCFDAQLGSGLSPMTLGSKLTINTEVVLSRQLKGQTVNFSVTTLVPASDLIIDVTPQSFTVGDEVNVPVSISLQLPTSSAFDGGKPMTLHAEAMAPATMMGDSQAVNLAVEPTVVVEYSGKGGMATPHTWAIPGNDPLKIGVAGMQAPTMIKLRPAGVKMMFVNKDTTSSHILHCSGAIPHQPTDKPTAPGGNYSPVIQTAGGASCYDHNLESQSDAVYFQFNK